ncbi:FG-GAP-like repeat-containing protein [Luteimonas sp. SX5]|uniref:FG-GAP-like repeat-containing protein n=1 Tax=Luteimonas galliterrae TaxID=2940486 RepID=A0ABT0MIC0_9GAMM|nr:FG-GAP-like repeat-containing protein [Luteimonas galliterrae]MCL1634619.1 FG-GAP-like repeat-containing protein [Luteimonas galliterrae]
MAMASRAAALPASGTFASLPDRGALAAYDRRTKPRISGAYRAYSVRLSEEHALKAARIGGQIKLVAPNGEPVDLAYERHIEHPDGNWTWIGRDASGADAVITFGAKAVFGSIPLDGEEPLRLTMAGGRSWLVETDSDKVVDADHAAMRASGKPDYFIPPKLAIGAAADKAVAANPQANTSAAAAAAAQTTVDVLLGYTNGFASAYGGQSQAVTRLTNLVDIANQAYVNSAVSARLRLVGTVAVTYTDANDNGIALEKLSGFNDNGPIPPDPAFAGLRAARNTLGADLVALVRDFRTPENAGCGIAWLIGGDQTPIVQADEPYGYSVVSDGSDVDEGDGNTYFCRDESLAHEFGHNMGQAHNVDDSSSAGAHAYSYGYRESTTNGFYTVMAYRLAGSNQFAIRHFANPAVQYSGRATGVANSADNARSMNQTMPIIATFRAAVSPTMKRNDVNGDGRSDLFWRQPSTARFAYWLMNGAAITSAVAFDGSSSYAAVGTGDMDGNGRADIVWHSVSGQVAISFGQSSGGFSTQVIQTLSAAWRPLGTGDVNADGKTDLFWRNTSTGQFAYWLMNGPTITTATAFPASASYTGLGTGDLDGNGRTDVIWQNSAGQTSVSLAQTSGAFVTQSIVVIDPQWTFAGTGDVNADGKADLLWRQPNTGRFAYWLMNGSTIAGSASFAAASGLNVVGSGDMDGNGRVDIAWQGAGGQVTLWLGQSNGGYVSQSVTTLTGWTPFPLK